MTTDPALPHRRPTRSTPQRPMPTTTPTTRARVDERPGAGPMTGEDTRADGRQPTSAVGVAADGAAGDDSAAADSLIAHERGEGYRRRGAAVHGDFIDEPRTAVTDADTLVGEVLDQLAETFRTPHAAPQENTVMTKPSGVAATSGTPCTSATTSSSTPLASSQGRTQIADAVVSKIAGPAAREITGVHDLGGGAARAFGAVPERIPGASSNVSQGIVVEVGEKRRRPAVADAPIIGFDQMRSLR